MIPSAFRRVHASPAACWFRRGDVVRRRAYRHSSSSSATASLPTPASVPSPSEAQSQEHTAEQHLAEEHLGLTADSWRSNQFVWARLESVDPLSPSVSRYRMSLHPPGSDTLPDSAASASASTSAAASAAASASASPARMPDFMPGQWIDCCISRGPDDAARPMDRALVGGFSIASSRSLLREEGLMDIAVKLSPNPPVRSPPHAGVGKRRGRQETSEEERSEEGRREAKRNEESEEKAAVGRMRGRRRRREDPNKRREEEESG